MAHSFSKNDQASHGKARAAEFTKGYARGGKVKPAVNVNIVLPAGDKSNAPGMAPPGPMLKPPLPPGAGLPPGGPPGMPPGPPGPPGMMARGGAVKMKAGSDSGEGRLQKKAAYGKNAKRG